MSQAQHVAEAAIEERNAARKARKRAEETVAEYEAATFKREQMEARVADLQRALMAQQAEETSFSSEMPCCCHHISGASVVSSECRAGAHVIRSAAAAGHSKSFAFELLRNT